jgi:hypothetical protein
MEIEPVIIEPPIEPPVSSPTPLVYNDTIDTSNMTNILLIDSIVYDKRVFYDSANSYTFPIIYDSTSKTDDLLALFRQKFPASSIQRISLVFHDRGPNIQAPFMNNKIFFEESDLEVNQTSFSENVSFLISCIKEFHVSHIDYLACNTLQYSNWKSYYALLASQTPVVVGASNDATGNMHYGGDWVMESTSEDVMNIYFNENISKYVSLLATSISLNGGYLYLRMDANNQYVQWSTNGTSWNNLALSFWPLAITNSPSPSATNILRVVLTTDINLTPGYTGGTNSYFIAGSSYITFDGAGKYVRVNGITNYPGFIQANEFASYISIQNYITDIIGSSTLAQYGGWLCQRYFGRTASTNVNITNCINYAPVGGSYGGGIVGSDSGNLNITNCINYSQVSGSFAGGIVGAYSKVLNITNCSSTGLIAGTGSGGIAGGEFGYNATNTYTISGCYSTGGILASNSGGIVGLNVGETSGSRIPVVNITNSYSLGTINTSCGGICGGGSGVAATTKPTINISNCYSFGSLFGSGQGLVASTLTSVYVNLTTSNTYVANRNWVDASANASLTGNPATNNPGLTWTSVSSNTPYISSLYNAQLYNPNSDSTTISYRTASGLFQPGFTYSILQTSQVVASDVLTTIAFASKGIPPYYNSYNSNSFLLTNTNPNGSITTMSSSINSLNGAIDIIIPAPTGLLTITADGSRQTIYIRMNGTLIECGFSLTGPWSVIYSYNWPVTIVNSNPGSSTILKVIVTEDLTLTTTYTGGTSSYFNLGSKYITFDGSNNYVRVNGITRYPGFINNGNFTPPVGFSNVVVQNFKTDIISNSTLDPSGGWLCQPYFGSDASENLITGCTNYAHITGGTLGYGGGIAGAYAGDSGTITFTNCVNYGDINVYFGGGIAGAYAGTDAGSATFINCTNNGKIIGNTTPDKDPEFGPGGIAGVYAAWGVPNPSTPTNLAGNPGTRGGRVTFTNCTNNGEITSSEAGGIVGSACASYSGVATFTGCVNNGNINGANGGLRVGGIVGSYYEEIGILNQKPGAANLTLSNCYNTGYLSIAYSGGILGAWTGIGNGNISVNNCYNTGDILAFQCAGIAGQNFAYRTTNTCTISNCYNIGIMLGIQCGGIAAGDTGRSNQGVVHTIDIINCYCVSDVGSSMGGILGAGLNTFNSGITTINLTNCYSSGDLIGSGQGMVSVDLLSKLNPPSAAGALVINITNCYVANGEWQDISANTSLTGEPTNLTTNNPGVTWTTLGTNTPYLLSGYTAQLYNPNSASSTFSYRTTLGLFQPGFTYTKIKATQAFGSNVLTTFAFTYKGTSPNYYAYNYNSFALTNTNSNGTTTTMTSTLNTLNGEIDIIVPAPLGLITITANGSTQSIYLRMNGTLIEYGTSITGPWSLIAINANWPVTIVNSNPGSSSILNVIFLENLTISNTYGNTSGYFIVGSEYITFNGENYIININNITGYPGFIQNGTSSSAGKSNVSVTNIITNVNNSMLLVNCGWICSAYFGRGSASTGVICLNNSVVNCTNNGNINVNSAGGIAGRNSGNNGVLSFTNCVNNGTITGLYVGGIVGQYAGYCDTSANTLLTFTGCVNNGDIIGYGAGGIGGQNIGNGKYPSSDPYNSSFNYQATTIFTNCSNNGNITGDYGGGIAGQYAGYGTGKKETTDPLYATSFINCNNTGSINGISAGGIVGNYAGGNYGSIYFENCTNTGDILVNANSGGGIAGSYVSALPYSSQAYGNSKGSFFNCVNSGNIIAPYAGGICGAFASQWSKSTFGTFGIDFISCSNSGNIIGQEAGGIAGSQAGSSYGSIRLTNCFSIGNISGKYAGGVVGSLFGYNNLYNPCSILNCYSTGNITGDEAGGIAGSDASATDSALSPVVNISNSYSIGKISGLKAGGIAGGTSGIIWNLGATTRLDITNCYSYGTISNGSSGILSPDFRRPLPPYANITNCYIANGVWNDASANISLIGEPTSLTINNPGTTWTTISTPFIPKVPYVLSSFNAQLYSPSSASSDVNYSTTPGLFQPNFNYIILYSYESGNVISPRVFASKGIWPSYYAYNFNTFTFTNTTLIPGSTYVAVAPSTGVLNFTLPVINEPIVKQNPNIFTPYAASPNNLGQVIYIDASYIVVPNIATNPTYILSTNVTDNTFDVFQNSATIPAAFVPNSLFISDNLISPSGIVKDSVGNFYVANSTYNVISVYNTNGLYLRKISVYSAINVPLNSINYIAIDSSNNLYITSQNSSGVYVVPAGSNENNLTSSILKYLYGNDFRGIACGSSYLYIVVKRLSPAYIIKYNLIDNTYLQLNLSTTITSGEPLAITYNNINTSLPPLYITTIDGSNNSIYTISNITGPARLIGGIGTATITFLTTFPNNLYPYSLTMDNSANLYVGLDEGRITPTNVRSVGKIARVTSTGSISNISYLTYNGLGIGRPEGLLFDGSLNLYATDILHNRVIKSRPKTFVFGSAVLNADAFYVKDASNNMQYKTYLYDITNSIISTAFNLTADCFQKGTKILCENDIYVPIENIKVGDLVKTYKHGYQKVMRCVARRSGDYVSSSRNQIYTYTQKSNPELTEDLYLTGGHSLLLDELSEIESNDMKQAEFLDSEFMVEDKYKLMCCFNKKLEVSANQYVELYRFTLEPPENATPTHVYGIWANGILSESSSKASMDK